ncbi:MULTISPECIES: hypothetical protein [Gordonibacter]|uniref:ABC transporter permease n=1 Tax=Gordonibacter faecis TaxID=3047475 RepID=A0ABT7DMN1_9ACTN|nr:MULTISPECIES: hypothetical protein [unclassified Gordonibacter]MDJ1649831.1 hypothetical protein [Gordonibacter sp. KGMB12511]HIW75495.1 hypothetical protein [Candidatus Gordonibacter avicola]
MFNLLKSDIYRLVHGKFLWVGLAILVVYVALAVGLVWFGTTPTFAQMVNEQTETGQAAEVGPNATFRITDGSGANLSSEEVTSLNEKVIPSRTYSYAQILISVGALTLLICLIIGELLLTDFEAGFAKNIFAGRGRRWVYYAEKLVLCAVVSAVFLLIGMALTDVGFALAGFEHRQTETLGEFWGWVVLAWLAVMMYATATAIAVGLTRSKAVSISFVILVSTGILASVVMTPVAALAPALPILTDLMQWLPTSSVKLLGSGGIGLLSSVEGTAVEGLTVPAQIALVAGVVIAACTALAVAVCPRKDV